MSKMYYQKQPRLFSEQVDLLISRGLHVENKDKAERVLTFISYNRLSNYWFPMFKEPKHQEIFKFGSSFDTIFKIYQFDSELRAITFHAIEQIVIAIRTQIIYHFSHKSKSGFWYKDDGLFQNYSNYVLFLSKITKN